MRSRFSLLGRAAMLVIATGLVAGSACAHAQAPSARVQLLVQDSRLAGYRHGAANEVWADLQTGDELMLVREPDNAFDANAIRVEWRGRKLGYVPRRENAAIAWALDRGDSLRARISKVDWHPNPARRIAFEVFVE